MRILIIEDDPVSQAFVQEELAEAGDLYLSGSGEEGLVAFGEALDSGVPFELVLIDVGLPGMDGLATLERIRALEEEGGVEEGRRSMAIIVTATADPRNVARAFFRGQATAYVDKPLTRGKLRRELERFGKGHSGDTPADG